VANDEAEGARALGQDHRVAMTRLGFLTLACVLAICAPTEAKIHRSAGARHHFKQLHPCPATGRATGKCPGYVIDHVKPLACGGVDDPSNMQWQTVAEAKAKDKWERNECQKPRQRS
jgi:hypothetical protein